LRSSKAAIQALMQLTSAKNDTIFERCRLRADELMKFSSPCRITSLTVMCAMLVAAAKQPATNAPADPPNWEVTQIWIDGDREWRSRTVTGSGSLLRLVRQGRANCRIHSYDEFCRHTPQYTEIRQLNFISPSGQSCNWTRITADIDFFHYREKISAYGLGHADALKNLKNICARALGNYFACTDPKRARFSETQECGGVVHVDLRWALGWGGGHKTRYCQREGFTSVAPYRGHPYRDGGACFTGPRGRTIPSFF